MTTAARQIGEVPPPGLPSERLPSQRLARDALSSFDVPIFSPVRHLLLPGLGAVAIGYPRYELIRPGQPHPFDRYPYIALGVLVLAALYAVYLNARDSTPGERMGSVIADAK